MSESESKKRKLLPYISGLHILPWFTDGAVNFLDSHIFYLKNTLNKDPRVFEFGGGGSTLYFLSRGCYTYSVDHDELWVKTIENVSANLSQNQRLWLKHKQRPYNKSILDLAAENVTFDLICIDGRDRVMCLETVINNTYFDNSILVLDNTERIKENYSLYLKLLRNYNLIHFETPFVFGSVITEIETTNGLFLNSELPSSGIASGVYRDRSGNCNKGRSITTIAIPLGQHFTTQGIPLI